MSAIMSAVKSGMTSVKTTCPYCGVGCGVLATPQGAGVDIAGDPEHPANFGRLCVKGSALGETVGLGGRLLQPLLRDQNDSAQSWQTTSWDTALDTVAERFRQTIAEYGPDSVALYVSGQLLTEDYYVANKLMKGYIGSANIDTNSRLCMSSAVAGHKRAFGEDVVPVDYEDLERADLIVLVGSNTAWCHPVLFQRMVAARAKHPAMRIVVIDPRRTATCEDADLHLPIRPGTDVALFNGLLIWLADHGCVDRAFVAQHTEGLESALAAARNDLGLDIKLGDDARSAATLVAVATRCGLTVNQVEQLFRWFAATPRTITAFSQGVNQSSAGTDKVNSIINCHLLTGRIGKAGAGPFSITGQPNAMGGREVGGLANQLAAHLDLENEAHRALVQRFWNSPTIATKPGYKAVELFDAVGSGKIKAIWIIATNPVVSLPDADRVRDALRACPFVVVSDIMQNTDTTQLAHVLLPATGWGERDGTVTNSERCITRQRPFLPAPGAARADWWIISAVATRLGFSDAFAYASAHEIFDEHAQLTAFSNDESANGIPRQLNLTGLIGLGHAGYDRLEPTRWPVLRGAGAAAGTTQSPRPFAGNRFNRSNGRAAFVALSSQAPRNAPTAEFPLVLNTGRIRDQWHTMSRTGQSPRLATHLAEPFAELHPADAEMQGIIENSLVRVSTRWGSCIVRARVHSGAPRGQIFVPIHWNDQTASSARVGALVNPVVDPLSGEPEFKHTPARIEAVPVRWHGFLMVREAPGNSRTEMTSGATNITAAIDGPPPAALLPTTVHWWTLIRGKGFWRYEFAGTDDQDWPLWTELQANQNQTSHAFSTPAMLESCDPAASSYRAAILQEDQLQQCLFVAARHDLLPARPWLATLFDKPVLNDADRRAVLAGRAPGATTDDGPIVCSCHGVGRTAIERAIRLHDLRSVQTLGATLKCGTGCGSCIPELKILLANAATQPTERRKAATT